MNRRIRFLGAVVALVALSAYFAESVRASMCLPRMDIDMTAAGIDADTHADMKHAPADDSDAPTSDIPECPLGVAGMGSSCVAMLMPAMTATSIPAPEGDLAGAMFVDDLHDLLISAAQFRPPRT